MCCTESLPHRGVNIMDQVLEQGCDGVDLLDLLFDQNDGILRHEEIGHHDDQGWPVPEMNMFCNHGEDFLHVILGDNDSVSGSPLWPPSPSDSGISEDQMDSPQRPESPQNKPPKQATTTSPQNKHPHSRPGSSSVQDQDFFISLNRWNSGCFPGRVGRGQGPPQMAPQGPPQMVPQGPPQMAPQGPPQMAPVLPLTVKDLLLSGCTDLPPQQYQGAPQLFQDLVLNEDEKKLLAKEGVTLPSQLPLTKYEERILKKIRRKIRNKQSAQESRKKKKEYIDGLESRMAACNANNQELQRKLFQLERSNTSLMEQLLKLQSLVMNGSSKPAQTRTCVLVLLLSFSLLLFPSLKPFSDTKVSQGGDFSPIRVQSRSLHNLDASRVLQVPDPTSSAPDQLNAAFPRDADHIAALLAKMSMAGGRGHLQPLSLNGSQDGQMRYHGDPITGNIAMVTLDPRRRPSFRPHADDM